VFYSKAHNSVYRSSHPTATANRSSSGAQLHLCQAEPHVLHLETRECFPMGLAFAGFGEGSEVRQPRGGGQQGGPGVDGPVWGSPG